jgi:hypothetical protein
LSKSFVLTVLLTRPVLRASRVIKDSWGSEVVLLWFGAMVNRNQLRVVWLVRLI